LVCVSSIGFGDEVVAIFHPIHAPIHNMARNAMKTGHRDDPELDFYFLLLEFQLLTATVDKRVLKNK
jgi:hypothetical protein